MAYLNLLVTVFAVWAALGPGQAYADRAGLVPVQPGESTADRAAVLEELLRSRNVVTPVTDNALRRALRGQYGESRSLIRELRHAVSEQDCGAVFALSDSIEEWLATRAALGEGHTPALAEFVDATRRCAAIYNDHRRASRAQLVAQNNGLSVPGASLALDATSGAESVTLHVTSLSFGDVYLDYERVGTAPIELSVPVGKHVVAVSNGHRVKSRMLSLSRDTEIALIPPPPTEWSRVSRLVTSLQSAPRHAPSPVRPVLEAAEIDYLILVEADKYSIWDSNGTRVATATSPVATVEAVNNAAVAQRIAEAPRSDLMRETSARRERKSPAWWVYAIAAGALATSVTLITVDALSEDRQRITVVVP